MSKLQMNDAKKLWNEMGDHKSWDSLHQVLQQHKNSNKGIDDSTVDLMLRETQDQKKSQGSFPDSPEKLAQVLNQHMSS